MCLGLMFFGGVFGRTDSISVCVCVCFGPVFFGGVFGRADSISVFVCVCVHLSGRRFSVGLFG